MKIVSKILLEAIEQRLYNLSADLEEDFASIVQGELSNRGDEIDFEEVEILYFEYSYDDFQLYFWGEDGKGHIIGNGVMQLPSKQVEGILVPELRNRLFDLEDVLYNDPLLEEDEVEEEIELFNKERCELFENWFMKCWSVARERFSWDKRAYFGVHDSYFKTKLN